MARTKTKSSKKWLFYFGVAIFLVVIGFVLYHKHAMASNKKNFQDARATIDNIYYDAVKQIGPADNAQISSSCSRSHVEFSKGELTCNLATDFAYSVKDESSANVKLLAVQKIIKNTNLTPTSGLSSELKDTSAVDSVYHVATDHYNLKELDCTASYIFDTPTLTTLKINTPNKIFQISLACSGLAKQQYYRLAS